ncbi:MAG TPA: uroporphyrinogen-III synthase [Gemmatimonadales bacterium]|nr:uroporphyrinogen-III synthase [Gemmatimonadales bacterium]
MRVAVTLARGTLPDLTGLLRTRGLDPVSIPLVRTEDRPGAAGLIPLLRDTGRFGAIAVTSPRGARALARALAAAFRTRTPGGSPPPIWAVGAASAAPVQAAGYPVAVPHESGAGATGLAAAMLEGGTAGPVLHVCGDPHREALAVALRAAGLPVTEVVVYRAVLAGPEEARAALAGAGVVVVGSHRVAELLAGVAHHSARPRLVALGPGVADTARRLGWESVVASRAPTAAAVAEAVWESVRGAGNGGGAWVTGGA